MSTNIEICENCCKRFNTAYEHIQHTEIECLKEQKERYKKVIQGMMPMWLAAMGFIEHRRHTDLNIMVNYYNGKENPLSNEDIHLMFILLEEMKQVKDA